MSNYENAVMVNVEAQDLTPFTAITDLDKVPSLQQEGWALVVFKEFQFCLSGNRLEVQVSKVLPGQTYGRHQLYTRVTAIKLARSKDCLALADGGRSIFGAFGSHDKVFWYHDPLVSNSVRTCAVFREVLTFSPSEFEDDCTITFDLEDHAQMRLIHTALKSNCLDTRTHPLYPCERSLVYQCVESFELVNCR